MTRSRVPERGSRSGPHLGPIQITPMRIVIAVAFIGSAGFIAFAILRVRDATQIPMLSSGFAVLGLALAAVAIGMLIQLWRAASEGSSGRAMLLGIVGGAVGLGAIGCFTATILLALLWRSGA
jgi:uncharacterized membrane protein YedE/YeeE